MKMVVKLECYKSASCLIKNR